MVADEQEVIGDPIHMLSTYLRDELERIEGVALIDASSPSSFEPSLSADDYFEGYDQSITKTQTSLYLKFPCIS